MDGGNLNYIINWTGLCYISQVTQGANFPFRYQKLLPIIWLLSDWHPISLIEVGWSWSGTPLERSLSPLTFDLPALTCPQLPPVPPEFRSSDRAGATATHWSCGEGVW